MITNLFNEYRNEFSPTNVYGHVIDLLKNNLEYKQQGEDKPIHVDLGCGYGAIAEHIRDELGRDYIGFDANGNAIASLVERGFEAHELILSETDEIVSFILSKTQNRKIGSITLIDTLEHLPNSQQVLDAMYKLAKENLSLVVISVPNILHKDIGFKLALGRINYTDAGLLDYTHVRMYDEKLLGTLMKFSGFHIVDRNHVRMNESDQHFPTTHPVLGETHLHTFLDQIRSNVNDYDDVNQLVIAALPGEKIHQRFFVAGSEREIIRPFLSVVTRTQGYRIQELVEFFTCMSGQTCRDFEILVMGHKLSIDRQIAIEEVLEDLPEWLRQKTRLITVDSGNRTRPLNVGFEKAEGKYIAIHDDDDLPFAHWVESFLEASKKYDGKILRCVSVLQMAENVEVNKKKAIRATSHFDQKFPDHFDVISHFNYNLSPNNTLAFPRGAFHDLNIKFDEKLTTTEDWDYILRSLLLLGGGTLSTITGIYRWFSKDNSKSMHSDIEWQQNETVIRSKLNSVPILLPPGSFNRITDLIRENPELKTAVPRENYSPNIDIDALMHERQVKLKRMIDGLTSTSWKVTSPIRFLVSFLVKKKPITIQDCVTMNDQELEQTIVAFYNSSSWKLTKPLRYLKNIF